MESSEDESNALRLEVRIQVYILVIDLWQNEKYIALSKKKVKTCTIVKKAFKCY